jgi:hypothetical protein
MAAASSGRPHSPEFAPGLTRHDTVNTGLSQRLSSPGPANWTRGLIIWASEQSSVASNYPHNRRGSADMGMVKIRAEYHDPFPGLHNDQSTSALGRRRGRGAIIEMMSMFSATDPPTELRDSHSDYPCILVCCDPPRQSPSMRSSATPATVCMA